MERTCSFRSLVRSSGGLGWYINDARDFSRTPTIFLGPIVILLLGIAVEAPFTILERRTIVRSDMKTGK